MRDHVTEELISAYIDGELEGDELKLVETLLAESPEHLQLLAEFQALRASLWSLPSVNLPADFHKRVVSQIDELAATPAKEPVQRAQPIRPVGRGSKVRPWRIVFFAAASVAAFVAFTMMLRPPTLAPVIPDSPGIVSTLVSMPDYFRRVPKYVMIYDLTVTPAGQENKAVETLLQNLGINIDPAMRLDEELENDVMRIRESDDREGEVTNYEDDPATPKSTDDDQVEMIYVAGKFETIDQFGMDLKAMEKVGSDLSEFYYGMALEPKKIGVMHRLHDSARQYLAGNKNIVPADAGQAFRLSFRVKLTSVSVPRAASFPMPGFVPTAQPDAWDLETAHILLIIRNVGANAADANPATDD